MKELSIEQKAKHYDEAIKRAKSKIKNDKDHVLYEDDVIDIFPELKENKKEWIEKIRQELKSYLGHRKTEQISESDAVHQWIVWLEKQGEQKSADKVEPKFKVGDWVVLTVGDLSATLQIANIDINKELYWFNDGSVLPFADEENLHLWTIKDANAGDVLYYNDDIIVIFKYFHDDSSFCSYCYIDGGVFFTSNGRTPVWWMNNVFYPANKEQRDYLFAKMEESGYEWDSNKKELVKQMTNEEHKQYMLEHQDETIYDMSFEEAQDFISKRGFDIPWNDGDVMVDERKLTQTVANVLKWADRHPLMLPYKKK
jgi:hypothetical protein